MPPEAESRDGIGATGPKPVLACVTMRRATRFLPHIVLLLLPFVFLHRGFLGLPDAVLGVRYWDMTTILYPERVFAVQCMRSGEFPLWNPYIFCGVPFHAGAIRALLYLPNAISFILPIAATFNLLFALHIGLAGLSTFALLRELGARPAAALFGAIASGCSARLLLHVASGQAPQAASLAWTPAIFWLAARVWRQASPGNIVGLAAVAGASIIAGYPQYPAYAAIGAAGVAAAAQWKSVVPVGIGLAGGAVIAAAQLLPGIEYAKGSFRSGGPKSFLATHDLPFENLATLLIPAALGDSARAPYFGQWAFWNTCVYAGVGTLAFAALALLAGRETRRRAIPWALLAAGAFLLALGDRTPLHALFIRLPIVGMFRGISKTTGVGLLALAVLSGLGMEATLAALDRGRGREGSRGNRNAGSLTRVAATILALIALAGIIVVAASRGDAGLDRAARHYAAFASANEHDPNGPAPLTMETRAAIRDAIAEDGMRLVAFAAALLIALVVSRRRAPRLVAPVAAVLLSADLFLAYEPVLRTQSASRDIEFAPELAEWIRGTPPLARFGASERREARGVLCGAAAVGGFEGNLPSRTHAYMNVAADRPIDAPPPAFQPSRLSPLLDLMVMQRLVLDGVAPIDTSTYRLVGQGNRFAIYDRAIDLPRAFLAHEVAVVPDRGALWGAIRDGRHDPFAVAAVLSEDEHERVDPLPPGAREPAPDVRLESPDRVVVRAQPAARAFLVLLDAYDPPWRATIDGRPARIVPAFGFFRGVYLEAGSHEVVFSYAPRSFTIGLYLSLAGTTAAIAIVAVGSARRRARWRSRSTSPEK